MSSELKSRIISIFDFFYNDNNIDEYDIGKIIPEKITLDHIKINNKETSKIILDEIKLGKFRLNKYKNNILRLIRYHESFPVLVKISTYKNDKEITDLESKPNRDSFFSFLLSEKVLERKINLVELPIINIDAKLSELKDIITGYPEIEEYEEKIGDKNISETLSVRIRERYFKSKTLLEHLENNKCDLKDILFQICLTLEQIKHYYPKFKHNNLDLSNINIYYKKDKGEMKTYYVGNEGYNYESPGFELKIGNFEDASLGEIIKSKEKRSDLEILSKNILESKLFSKIICNNESLEIIKKISGKSNSMDSVEPISPKKIMKTLIKDSRKITVSKENKSSSQDYYLGKKNSLKIKGKISKDFGNVDFMDKKIKRKYKKSSQKGGAIFKPSTRNLPNNPHLSNDARVSFKKLQNDKPMPREPPVLAEQKVYQPTAPAPRAPNPNMYPPLHIPVKQPQYNMTVPYQYEINKMPIQNIYNISLADPRGDHSTLARVYEDMVPGKEYGLSSNNIRERIDSSNYIKSIMVNMRDGNDVSLTGGEGSLLEHMMLSDINPYHYRTPYDDLPADDFLLYTSAYPVRYDNEKSRLKLSKSSQGLNLRMYGLSNEELASKYSGHASSSASQHGPWQDLEYYNRINEIVKTNKLSPNFVMMHFWVFDKESRIKYSEIKNLKNNKLIFDKKITQISEKQQSYRRILNDRLRDLLGDVKKLDQYKDLKLEEWIKNKVNLGPDKIEENKRTFAKLLDLDYDHPIVKNKLDEFLKLLKQSELDKMMEDSQVSLGIITESPTSTFTKWASPVYTGSGSLRTMSQTGYHDYKVYESILFQYIHALAVMQEKGIALGNFNPLYNLFVKDIYADDRDTKHWRYVVDGIDYYVPNYGYVAMIDSFYGGPLKAAETREKKVFLKSSGDNTFEKVYEHFKNIIDVNFYKTEWRSNGAHPVPTEFIELLDKLNRITSTNVKEYLKVFTNLLNNRIGEKVTNTEMNNIDLTRFPGDLKTGSIVARRDDSDYKWCLVKGKSEKSGVITQYLVQTEKSRDAIPVFSSQLFVSNDTIEPKVLNGVKYDSYNMIEKYVLGN